MDIFKIIRIDEQDHGCEGIPEGQEPKCEVTIEAADGKQFIMQIEDALLYERGLNEGDSFRISEDGTPVKCKKSD